MSRHDAVSCDSCLKGNFRGKRYKCLICYDYDLCAVCFESGATTTRHTTEHPMQCILTRSDFDLYYAGETLNSEQPQAFTCPYCGKMGFTEASLQEHVAADHAETTREVICPICASFPGGEANQITDDFAGHLTLEHRSGPRDLISFLDEPATSRPGVRRMPHTSRGVTGPRTRRSNMHFSSSGGLSPSSRETVDPITELLSQLSGVRSPAVQASTSSTLQQLQMQLQLERQQVRAARQQVERLPRRPTQSASSGCNSITLAAPPVQDIPTQPKSTQSQFLLSRCMEEILSDAELQTWEQERADRSLFVQELFLSTLAGIEALCAPNMDPLNLSGSRGEQGNIGINLSSISDEIGNIDGVQASSNSETSRQSQVQQGEENSQASSLQTQTSNLAVAKNSATCSKRVARQSPSVQTAGPRIQSSLQGSTSGSHPEVRAVPPARGILAPQQQSEEDEWRELHQRFEKEGLDCNALKTEEKLLHVWRWLVDAESNLRSSRRMIDKLREQQHEDLEEMECYVGHIKELAEKRADHLETETMCLRSRLESSQHQTATLTTLLERSGLEGIADASLGEQVAFLIADRAKLMEEIAVLNKLNGLNGVSKEADLIAEIIKVSSEKEVLKHEAAEYKGKVVELEKFEKQLELDNERLAFKLSEALAELEERESQLKEIVSEECRKSGMQTSMSMIWPRRESPSPPPGRRRQSAGDTLDGPRRSSPIKVTTTKKKYNEQLKAFAKTWNADTPPEIKVSSQEHLDEIPDNTGSLPRSISVTERDMIRSQSYGADSTPPSLMLSECASEKMQVKLDAQMQASRTELVRLEEIKRLQADADSLKAQLNGVIEKYNALVVRHVQHKARRKAQISDLRARLQLEAGALEVQIQSLQAQLTNQKLVLRGEEGLRKKIETDYRKSLSEKRSLMVNVMSLENSIREKDRELSVIQKKVSMLETANKDLMARLLQVKYSYPSRSRSLSRVEGVLTDLGAV